jgi:selenide, water dikinase
VLRRLPRQTDPQVLVGFDTNDDAGVYLLENGTALVQTVDFFTPIVDDPQIYGEIAAANSLSDVYAMGGRPFSSLSLVGFPEKGDPDLLEKILRGGLAKMQEAHCTVVGGHSVRNEDLLFGYCVSGLVDPQRIWKNVGAVPGDALLLTKPLGTGIITTALKKDRAPSESLAAAVASMAALNRSAAEALHEVESSNAAKNPIHAVTDITGFGLLGHAHEMVLGSPDRGVPVVSIELDHKAVAYLPGALELAREGHLPGGLLNNRSFLGECVEFAAGVPRGIQDLLFDPQTSGGLLVSISAEASAAALMAFERHAVAARRIGRILEKQSPPITVL